MHPIRDAKKSFCRSQHAADEKRLLFAVEIRPNTAQEDEASFRLCYLGFESEVWKFSYDERPQSLAGPRNVIGVASIGTDQQQIVEVVSIDGRGDVGICPGNDVRIGNRLDFASHQDG
jgi:hypothetical protein